MGCKEQLLVAQKFWAETKRSRRFQTPTANDALAHAFVSRLPSGSNNTVLPSSIVMSAIAVAYVRGTSPHTLRLCLTISRMLHVTSDPVPRLTDNSMVSDNFYPQPGMSYVSSSEMSSHGS